MKRIQVMSRRPHLTVQVSWVVSGRLNPRSKRNGRNDDEEEKEVAEECVKQMQRGGTNRKKDEKSLSKVGAATLLHEPQASLLCHFLLCLSLSYALSFQHQPAHWLTFPRVHQASQVESSQESFDPIHFDSSPFTLTASIQVKSLFSGPLISRRMDFHRLMNGLTLINLLSYQNMITVYVAYHSVIGSSKLIRYVVYVLTYILPVYTTVLQQSLLKATMTSWSWFGLLDS